MGALEDEKARSLQQVEDVSSLEKRQPADHPGTGDYSGAVAKTDAKEIALVRKLDFRLMPTLWAMYFLNYLDRNAITQAKLDDLEKDLNLKGNQYNTCISILFVGYVYRPGYL